MIFFTVAAEVIVSLSFFLQGIKEKNNSEKIKADNMKGLRLFILRKAYCNIFQTKCEAKLFYKHFIDLTFFSTVECHDT